MSYWAQRSILLDDSRMKRNKSALNLSSRFPAPYGLSDKAQNVFAERSDVAISLGYDSTKRYLWLPIRKRPEEKAII